MPKILVVEDEMLFAEIIKRVGESLRAVVEIANNGDQALAQLRINEYDLIILDWGLPGLSGVEVLKQFRAKGGKTPILMLTAKNQIENKEAGLDAGADDYLTKPFEGRELAARIRALMRRQPEFAGTVLHVRDITLDTSKLEVKRSGESVRLQPTEFALLEFFMKHPNQVFTTEALASRVWSSDSEIVPDSVRTFIKRLRNKLDKPDEPSIIKTAGRQGYILESSD